MKSSLLIGIAVIYVMIQNRNAMIHKMKVRPFVKLWLQMQVKNAEEFVFRFPLPKVEHSSYYLTAF